MTSRFAEIKLEDKLRYGPFEIAAAEMDLIEGGDGDLTRAISTWPVTISDGAARETFCAGIGVDEEGCRRTSGPGRGRRRITAPTGWLLEAKRQSHVAPRVGACPYRGSAPLAAWV